MLPQRPAESSRGQADTSPDDANAQGSLLSPNSDDGELLTPLPDSIADLADRVYELAISADAQVSDRTELANTVSGLITNFHLPKSSLLVLVRTFAGDKLIKQAYQEAIDEEYRFFSYGDAMLIL